MILSLPENSQTNKQINGEAAWADTCQSASSDDSLIRFSCWHSKYPRISSQYKQTWIETRIQETPVLLGQLRGRRRGGSGVHIARESELGSTEPHSWQRTELPAMEQETLLPNAWPHKSHCYLNRSILWEGRSNTGES